MARLRRASDLDPRVAVATSGALALVALAGLASGASPWEAQSHASQLDARILAGLVGVVVAALLLLAWIEPPAPARPKRRAVARKAAANELSAPLAGAGRAAFAVLGVVIFLSAVLLPLATDDVSEGPLGGETEAPAPAAREEAPRRGSGDSGAAVWLLVGGAVTLALLGPAALVVRARRARQLRASGEPRDPATPAAGLSIADIETEADVRVALELAYARMGLSLAGLEVVRAVDETPSEFLDRAVRTVSVSSGAVSELTELFELARFSAHELADGHRRQAVAALRRIESELTGPS